MTAWLAAEIRKSFVPPWNAVTERAIFGEIDPDGIVEAIDAGCERVLGAGIEEGFLYQVSTGIVIGCQLTDGRQVVLKAYQSEWTMSFLAAVKRIQGDLHAAGYPCPRPFTEELAIGSAYVLVESALPDPGMGTPSTQARSALAAGLAELVARCSARDEPALHEHPLRRPHDGVFPKPHSPMFDFDATRVGAEWIEDIAVRARNVIAEDNSVPVIAHTDWSLRNVRVNATGPTAVYDWDSLALLREPEAVAMGAATWCKTGGPDDPTPTVDDIEQYVGDYEAARDGFMTSTQHRALRAAVVASLAYTARCEHAIDPHQHTWTTTRPRLREAAAALLHR